MPVFDLYGAFILPALPVLGVTYDATAGAFGKPVAPVLAFTDGLTPEGRPYEDWGHGLDPEVVDVGSTFRVAGEPYVATRAWHATGETTMIDENRGGGGIYIYEVTNGSETLLLAFPNCGGLVRPEALQSFRLTEDLIEVTGISNSLIWPGYHFEDNGTPVPCFVAGTRIACPCGERAVEAVGRGDAVALACGGTARVLWAGRRVVTAAALAARPALAPVRIRAGALGQGLPRRDLRVSPQHRMLVASRAAARIVGAAEVLVAARRLVGLPGIAAEAPGAEVAYHHLLLERHGLILAEGAPAESLLPGPMALAAYPPAARLALIARAAECADLAPARPIATGAAARALVAAHAHRARPLLDHWRAALAA